MNQSTCLPLIPLSLVACAGSIASADELRVPAQYPSIGAAVKAAQSGDYIRVSPGYYTGSANRGISFAGKTLVVYSVGGPGTCTIDAERDGSIFILENNETSAAIQGFTLIGATTSAIRLSGAEAIIVDCIIDGNWNGIYGGGILCEAKADVTVVETVLSNNLAGVGGGIYLDGAQARLSRCTITGNRTDLFGAGGVGAVKGSTLALIDCVVNDNTAMGFAGNGGGVQVNASTATITNTLITGNYGTLYGGGMTCVNGGDITITNCTIADNLADSAGGGLYLNGKATINNSIFWNNIANEIEVAGGTCTVAYSTVEGGWPGTGVLLRDPQFVNAASGDYQLSPGAFAIDAGSNAALASHVEVDLNGNRRFVDIYSAPNTGVIDPTRPHLPIVDHGAFELQRGSCYADCDTSTGVGVLDIFDFLCFQDDFIRGDPYGYACDCDYSGAMGVCDIFDFLCFQNAFVAGCP